MSEFLQLLGTIVPVCAIVIVAMVQNKKLQEIHVLVNSQLTQAIDRIGKLEEIIRGLRSDADNRK